MKSRSEIFQLLETNRETIKSFGVTEIGVFGSVAQGSETEKSDIDVLVDFEKKNFASYMNLLFFLEELFGCKVDLVTKGTIKPIIRDSILSQTQYVKNL